MKQYLFRIKNKDDNRPMFPEFTGVEDMELVGVGIEDGVTESGRPGVVLIIRKPGHQLVHAVPLTAAAFLTLAAGMKGAMERWGEPWRGA